MPTALNRTAAATDESRTAGCTNGRGAAAEPERASPTERRSRAAAARVAWSAASACWAT